MHLTYWLLRMVINYLRILFILCYNSYKMSFNELLWIWTCSYSKMVLWLIQYDTVKCNFKQSIFLIWQFFCGIQDHIVIDSFDICICSIQKNPEDRLSSLDLLVCISPVCISNFISKIISGLMCQRLDLLYPVLCFQSHPFIKKFEDKDIDLGILVSSLEPPVNFPR